MKAELSRPFVYMNVAMTADGKIAPANRKFTPFGSRRDQEHLLELRAQADAVMAGARTVDLFPVNLGPGGKKYREMRLKRRLAEYNLRVIVSGAGSINPKAKIFEKRFSPIIILVTGRIPERRYQALARVADEVRICGPKEIDWPDTLEWLREKWGVKRLLCEGGGALNDALFRAGAGGRSAPDDLSAHIWRTGCADFVRWARCGEAGRCVAVEDSVAQAGRRRVVFGVEAGSVSVRPISPICFAARIGQPRRDICRLSGLAPMAKARSRNFSSNFTFSAKGSAASCFRMLALLSRILRICSFICRP